ncbi:hypothetical protein CRG98_031904 [Punica granatum]|uniref:EF-hand domain-containing protein n=1 Tax=Punica granatum TaxID=22663 RepID=A0A2I0IUU2_PUNGR|nr:hypothetical protein CRG98_031904 [Punica granatum]
MQSTRIPQAITDEVERLCRNFIWGHTAERRRIHLVNWDTVAQPLSCGGLGIRRLKEFNDAFLAKICWGLMNDWANAVVPMELRENPVNAYVNNEGNWRWDLFSEFLPHQSVLKIASMVPPSMDRGEDRPFWNLSVRGLFTMGSAYKQFTKDIIAADNLLWKSIWRWKGPQRVDDESILHALRDCPSIQQMWQQLLVGRGMITLSSDNRVDWLLKNLSGSKFESNGCGHAYLVLVAGSSGVGATNRNRTVRNIGWILPDSGWLKLNIDGAAKGSLGMAGAGGFLRDDQGRWIGGFAQNIGVASVITTEMWGVRMGLALAWESGARRIILEVDSECLELLGAGLEPDRPEERAELELGEAAVSVLVEGAKDLAELREIFRSFDKNGDGSLTELELGEAAVSVLVEGAKDLAELREIFRSFDKNGDGSLTELELGEAAVSVLVEGAKDLAELRDLVLVQLHRSREEGHGKSRRERVECGERESLGHFLKN